MSGRPAAYPSRAALPDPVERLAADRTALVVVDMQNDFCAPGGYIAEALGRDVSGLATVVEPIRALLSAARAGGVPVVWLTASYEDERLPPSMRTQKARLGITAVCCRAGTWGADFFGVAPAPGEPVLVKSTYSGFSNPALAETLAGFGAEALVFCGVQTNVCVESTLRDAHTRGFDVAVVSDAVGSHAPPLHEATLANVRFLLGDVISAADLIAAWPARAAA